MTRPLGPPIGAMGPLPPHLGSRGLPGGACQAPSGWLLGCLCLPLGATWLWGEGQVPLHRPWEDPLGNPRGPPDTEAQVTQSYLSIDNTWSKKKPMTKMWASSGSTYLYKTDHWQWRYSGSRRLNPPCGGEFMDGKHK